MVSAAFELARKEYPYDRRKLAENVLLATYPRDTSAAGIFELLHDHMAPGEYDLVVLDVAQVPLMVLGLASFHEACVRLCEDKEAALAFTCPDERFITQEFADVLVHAERERAVAWATRDESATS